MRALPLGHRSLSFRGRPPCPVSGGLTDVRVGDFAWAVLWSWKLQLLWGGAGDAGFLSRAW